MYYILDLYLKHIVKGAMIEYKQLSDEDLFQLVKANEDRAAYSVLYHRLFDTLYRTAFNNLKDHDIVTDIVQDIFVSLWEKREHIEIQTKVKHFLYSAVFNQIKKRIRSEKIAARYIEFLRAEFNEGFNTTESIIAVKEINQIFDYELSRMSERTRLVFELTRKEDLRYKEIAAIHDMPESSVRNCIRRGLALLRKSALNIKSLL